MRRYEVTFSLDVEDNISRVEIQAWAEKVTTKFKADSKEDNSEDKIKVIFIDEKKEYYEDEDTLWRKDK